MCRGWLRGSSSSFGISVELYIDVVLIPLTAVLRGKAGASGGAVANVVLILGDVVGAPALLILQNEERETSLLHAIVVALSVRLVVGSDCRDQSAE